MKNKIIILFLFILQLFACVKNTSNVEIDRIIVKADYSFFKRGVHARKLYVYNDEGKVIDSQKLHDNVDGCKGGLFDCKTLFYFIDCDGNSYEINKVVGSIKKIESNWGGKLPDNFLGYFTYDRDRRGYLFYKDSIVTKNEIYKYGGNVSVRDSFDIKRDCWK